MNPILWLFGLPSSGKTTLSKALRDYFQRNGKQVVLLDGDEFRAGVCEDLGFSDADRLENLRRAANLAKLIAEQDHLVICSFVTPKEHHRQRVRQVLKGDVRFVHIDCPLDTCVTRDVKGLYAKAAARKMTGMTGTQDEFEAPQTVDAVIPTHRMTVHEAVRSVSGLVEVEESQQLEDALQKPCLEKHRVTEWKTHELRTITTTQGYGGRRRRFA